MTQRFFILDAFALIYRSYHAFSRQPLTSETGLPTSAIFGCANFIHQLVQSEQPDFLVVAADTQKKTFRHELYPDYKAHRKPMPPELVLQIPHVERLFSAMGLPVLKEDGLEADDIIGSLVHRDEKDVSFFILSGDKDFMQLVREDVTLLKPLKGGGGFDPIGPEGVMEKLGVRPDQVIDILAIMGDSSDNVPGVKGIGEKGAAKLIQEFGSLEDLYEQIDAVKNAKLREKLLSCKENALLSKKLVTIKTDAPCAFDLALETCAFKGWGEGEPLLALYDEFSFHSLKRKVKASPPPTPSAPKSPNKIAEKNDYRLIQSNKDLAELLELLKKAKEFSFDTETTGLDRLSDKPIGLSFGFADKKAFYLPLSKDNPFLDIDQALQDIQAIWQENNPLLIGHHVKFDLQMAKQIGLTFPPKIFDTMVAAHLIDPEAKSVSLDASCLQYLNYQKISTQTVLGDATSMSEVSLPELSRYACEDADLTFQLYEHLLPLLRSKELISCFFEVEMPLVSILAQMEQEGIYVDPIRLEALSSGLDEELKALRMTIVSEAGEEFNVNSPKQLADIIYQKLDIPGLLGVKSIKKTKTGWSTDVKMLEKLKDHPLPKALLEYRTLHKLKTTYADALPSLIHPQTKRIHTHFHQTITATGRLSSSKPNLQNVPIRSQEGRQIRRAFRASSQSNRILSFDYSQIELRLLAHLSEDPGLCAAFQGDEDIHARSASALFQCSLDQVTSEERSLAKAINFGLIYGMGASRLARDLKIPPKEAKAFIETYFQSFPLIKKFIDEQIGFAREHGYVKTISGRRRPLPDIHSAQALLRNGAENMAVNTPIQGSASELLKLAMAQIQKKLEESSARAKMMLQVHDELVFECHEEDVEGLTLIVKTAMEQALALKVPLKVGVGCGMDWLEASDDR